MPRLADDPRAAYLDAGLRGELLDAVLDEFAHTLAGTAPDDGPPSVYGGAEIQAAADALAETLAALGVYDNEVDAAFHALRNRPRSPPQVADDPTVTAVQSMSGVFHALPTLPDEDAALLGERSALLRVRATSVAAAQALLPWRDALPPDGITLSRSAPDELLASAGGPLDEAARRLVELLGGIVRSTDAPARPGLQSALVAFDADVDDPELSATLAANRALPDGGLLAVDDHIRAALPGLHLHPRQKSAVDPLAPFAADRWKLAAQLPPPPFVGRDKDIAWLADRLAAGDDDRPGLIVLHGPSGVGKTSCLRQALAAAGYDDERAPVLWGAVAHEDPEPLRPVVAMVRALADAAPGNRRAAARLARLLDGLGEYLSADDAAELLRYHAVLGSLVGALTEVGDQDEAESLGPRARIAAVRRALVLICTALSHRADGRPVVVVVPGADDWLPLDAAFFTFLAEQLGPRLRLVLVCPRAPRLRKAFTDKFVDARRGLKPLPAGASKSLCASWLGEHVDASAFIEKSKGSPFVLTQAIRLALEQGTIVRTPEGFDTGQVRRKDVWASGERIVRERFAHIPDHVRRVLGFCALFGEVFMPAAAEFVAVRLGVERDALRIALKTLLHTGLLRTQRPRPAAPVFADTVPGQDNPSLAFAHPLVRAVALELLTKDERQTAHELVAEAYDILLPDAEHALPGPLARHLAAAGARRRAAEMCRLAARRAHRWGDAAGAQRYVARGLEQKVPDEVFGLLLEGERNAEGSRQVRVAALKKLLKAAEQSGQPRDRMRGLLCVARFNVLVQDPDKAVPAAHEAVRLAAGLDDERASLQGLRLLALAEFARGRLDDASRALNEAEAAGPGDAQARAALRFQRGVLERARRRPLFALDHFLWARVYRRQAADPSGEAACLDMLAEVLTSLMRYHTAETVLDQALELRRRIGDDSGRAETLAVGAELSLMLADLDTAQARAEKAQALAMDAGLSHLEQRASVLLARIFVAGGDIDEAERILSNLKRRKRDRPVPRIACEIASYTALCKWRKAREAKTAAAKEQMLRAAKSHARTAADLGEAHGVAAGQTLGPALLGATLHALDETADAMLYTQRAFEVASELGPTAPGFEVVALEHAALAVEQDDEDEAQSVYRDAVEALEQSAASLSDDARARFWSLPSRVRLREALTALPAGKREAG